MPAEESPNEQSDDDAAPSFLHAPPVTPAVQRLYDSDVEDDGYVMNLSQVWAHDPAASTGWMDLVGHVAETAGLTLRQRGVLVSACAAARGDSYCALAWGPRLAGEVGAEAAAAVLQGNYELLDPAEQALANWAAKVARDPSGTSTDDVETLRSAGFDDTQIFDITAFVALRLAFSAINDALGARPDRQLWEAAPQPIREAVTYGRPADGQND